MKRITTPTELGSMLKEHLDVQVFDVRLKEDREPVTHEIPGASWRNPNDIEAWAVELNPNRPVVIFCVHGLRVSQGVQQALEEKGFEASILKGGINAWQDYAETNPAGGR